MSEFKNDEQSNPNSKPVILESLAPDDELGESLGTLERVNDVEIPVRVIFAKTKKTTEEVLAYCEGEVIKLNRFAGEPVDVYVGERVIAKGEITVVDDSFGVRIVEILPSGERLEERRK